MRGRVPFARARCVSLGARAAAACSCELRAALRSAARLAGSRCAALPEFPGRKAAVDDVRWTGRRQDEAMIQHSLLVLVLLTSTAIAQPGTPTPAERPAPAGTDLDALIAKAQAEAPTIETVVRGTFRRARSALSIGPTVGLWTGMIIGPGDIDAALTIGVGFETFKVPVLPELETIQDLIVERVKAQLKQRIIETFKARQPARLELETLAKQVYEDVRSEILGLENVRPKTFERPQF